MRERGDPLRFNDQFLEFVQSVFCFLVLWVLHGIAFGGANLDRLSWKPFH